MRRSHVPPQVPWTAFAALVVRLMVTFTVFYTGGAIARWFGFQQHWSFFAVLFSTWLAYMVLLLVQELPRQGLRFMSRWLMSCAFVVGWMALVWSATQVRYNHWVVFYGSFHVLLAIGFVLLLGWVSAGRAMSAIVFGKATKAVGKPPAGVDDRWLD